MSGAQAMPDDGPEKDIFLRALRSYSEECEPPALTAGCPFRRQDPKIGYWCLDECVDLLALHNAPPAIDEMQVGEFQVQRGRRPRSRRGLGLQSKVFDAREQFLADQNQTIPQRGTVSLLYGLNMYVSGNSRSESDANIVAERMAAELTCRGFDVEMLVREGMSKDIAVGILWAVLIPRLLKRDGVDVPEGVREPADWSELVLRDEQATGQELVSSVLNYGPAVEHWARNAPLNEVLTWSAPTKEDFQQFGAGAPPEGTHRWLCDRFLKTYLSDWSTDSLKSEWEYLHGGTLPPCSVTEMTSRRVDENDVAIALADRVARNIDARSTSIYRFVQIAVDLVRDGKRTSAAAIFEAIIASEPSHGEAQNNFAFCILPDNPQRALFALHRAAELGYEGPANIGNRILAFALLGRLTPALDLAERFAERTNLPVDRGWMWAPDLSGKEIRLIDVPDMVTYIFDLALAVAEASGDEILISDWRTRRAGLDPTNN